MVSFQRKKKKGGRGPGFAERGPKRPLTVTNSSEDCYYLAEAIPDFDHTKPLSTEHLSSIFKSFAEKQQPHTSVLVNGARALGRARVAPPEACVQSDTAVAQSMADRAGLQAKFDFTYSRPFQRPS